MDNLIIIVGALVVGCVAVGLLIPIIDKVVDFIYNELND